jgi:hypothetical protein
MDLVNCSRTPNCGQYLMKTALKYKNDAPLKNVLSVMGLVSHPETPKLWAISHENGPNMY